MSVRSLNTGPTQVDLDALDDVEVDGVPLDPPGPACPHLELLHYRRPQGRPCGLPAPADRAATRIVSRAGREALVRDPDGHLHQLTS